MAIDDNWFDKLCYAQLEEWFTLTFKDWFWQVHGTGAVCESPGDGHQECLSHVWCTGLDWSVTGWCWRPPEGGYFIFLLVGFHLNCFFGPHGLTFTWWGCYGLCLWHELTELALSFLFCSCICFCLYGLFNCISFHKLFQQLSVFSLFSYLCLVIPFSYMSLYESLLQPWLNPKWLTWLKAPNN